MKSTTRLMLLLTVLLLALAGCGNKGDLVPPPPPEAETGTAQSARNSVTGALLMAEANPTQPLEAPATR